MSATRQSGGPRFAHKRALLVLGAVLALSCATIACSALLGLEPPPSGTDGIDGGNDGPTNGTVDAAGCMTRYVSAISGDDGQTGCTPAVPLKTIKAAISAFESEGLTGYTVEVCAGAYPESNLKMQSRGNLMGGYNCKTWTRTGTYALDQVNETIISVATPDSTHFVPLTIGPATIDAGVADADVPDGGAGSLLVDGFTIVGPSNVSDSYAVQVNQSATGTISNCRLSSGDPSGAASTSYGVFVVNASPTISNNLIQSGVAATTAGVFVRTINSSPWIHGNTVTSNDALAGGVGSFGIEVTATGGNVDSNRIEDNTVIAGNGAASEAIRISGAVKGIVRRNHAQSLPTGAKNAGLGLMYGIRLENSSSIQVLYNRAYAGGSNGGVGPMTGISVQGGKNVVIANNMVYGGFEKPIAAGSDLNAFGIVLAGTAHPVVVYNTIFSGFSPGSGSRAYDIAFSAALDGTSTTDAVVQNNIFAGSGVNDFGVYIENCANGLDTFENNVFFAQQTGLAYLGCDAGGPRALQDMTQLSKMGAKSLDGNITLRSVDTCGKTDDAGGCIVQKECPFFGITTGAADGGLNLDGSPGCVDSVFGAWSTDNGNATLLSNTGWVLGPTAPCAVSAGGRDLTDAGFTQDINGKQRDAAPSMGAAQANPTCP